MLGVVKVFRDNLIFVKIENLKNLIDICGIGGDGGKIFNIFIVVVIVVASGGVKVVKYGNCVVLSKSGSVDVLSELKIKVDYDKNESKRIIEEKGMVFLFVFKYNGVMKNVVIERKELVIRIIFNLIGLFLNLVLFIG